MTTTAADRRAQVLEFLRRHDADTTPHIFGDLLTHLLGTEELVRAWDGSEPLALAALGHATYGTDGFEPHLLDLDRRSQLVATIGAEPEELVYFYASCDRHAFYPQLTSPATRHGDLVFRDRFTGAAFTPTPGQVTRFVDLTYANEVELAASSPGGPSELTWLADFCRDAGRWASPGFHAGALALLGTGG